MSSDTPLNLPEFEATVPEEDAPALSAAEAAALEQQQKPLPLYLTLWCQVVAVMVLLVLLWVVDGVLGVKTAQWQSAMGGAAAVLVPQWLLTRWMVRMRKRQAAIGWLMSLTLGEMMKFLLSLLILFAAATGIEGKSWLILISAFIGVLKLGFFLMLIWVARQPNKL